MQYTATRNDQSLDQHPHEGIGSCRPPECYALVFMSQKIVEEFRDCMNLMNLYTSRYI